MVTFMHALKFYHNFYFSDNVISVHDLTVFNLPLLCTVTQTKGATAFDLDLKVNINTTLVIYVLIELMALLYFTDIETV